MDWIEYFRQCVDKFDFKPWYYEGVDKNLLAFRSKQAFKDWYAQPPGPWHVPGVESYRDEAFYVRELTTVSMLIQPKRIVELGIAQGIGTILLHILNPQADIFTVDSAEVTDLAGHIIPIGYLAKHENIPAQYFNCQSHDFVAHNIDLTFIDANHTYEYVKLDQQQAWVNRNPDKGAIIWHDCNERHPGVIKASGIFCHEHNLLLHLQPDSCTVWTAWGLNQ